ncbi:MAG: RNA polymerase sigma factor [Acidobacteriia bacterium]|nr:RNA polymerase sigma factor [Terriglobia bacterium]
MRSPGMATATSWIEPGFLTFLFRLEMPSMPISSTATDVELARGIRQGNPEAVAVLVERYSPRLHRYLAHLVNESAGAEDLLQETWLRVMEHIDSYNVRQPLAAWLFTIAHNCAIDSFRREKKFAARKIAESMEDPSDDGMDKFPDGRPSVLADLEDQEIQDRTAKFFGVLPAHYREALALRFQQEMPLQEISRVLQIPLSTVKSRLKRGLELLRDRLVAQERI